MGNRAIYQFFNVVDEKAGNAIAVWADSLFYLYALEWSQEIVDGLLSRIELKKFSENFTFCGTSELILALFKSSEVDYEIYKNRAVFECSKVRQLQDKVAGEAYFSDMRDLDVIAKMYYQYGLEEWGERGGRDQNYATKVAFQTINKEKSCHWQVGNRITAIASILEMESPIPIIGTLYTNPEDRRRGYAKALLQEIVRQFTEKMQTKIGIISDLNDPATNKLFRDIGFEEVSRFIYVNTKVKSSSIH